MRNATTPRNITLTMNDNGFYKTLKSRIREKLKTIDYKPSKTSDVSFLYTFAIIIRISTEKDKI